jgi:ubiquinone biosynthesis protein COQ9
MTGAIETSGERDAAIEAMLPLFDMGGGWNRNTLRRALTRSGAAPDDAEFLFPGGAIEMVEAFCDLADRRMTEAADLSLADQRVSARVRSLIALRLSQAEPHRAAVRHALALLALPRNFNITARTAARTADAIWHAAGDSSADFSWYTKRATLAAVYSATLLFWLRDHSDQAADTLGFLDRRLGDLGRIAKLRRRLPRFS